VSPRADRMHWFPNSGSLILRRPDIVVTSARRQTQTTARGFCSATKNVRWLLRCTKNVAMQQKL
ncbi:hypothetical protein, partial [Mesorhizobium sp. M8A.F.Ca.ET.167.01.1.1]|uniref:hypothetical protein n=1 Tax=Mesorhizobium sp. M8A.F.Ca.ET.167.01.1.1 TaxID=2563961 RepID=UPI001FDFB4AD